MQKEKQEDKIIVNNNINVDSDNSKPSNISLEEPNTLIKTEIDLILPNTENPVRVSYVDLVDSNESSIINSLNNSIKGQSPCNNISDNVCFDRLKENQNTQKPIFFNFESQLFKQNKDYQSNLCNSISFSKVKNLNDLSSSVESDTGKNIIRIPSNIIIPSSLALVELENQVITSNCSENSIPENLNQNLSINDIVEVYCETDSKIHKGKILQIESSLTLKNNNIKSDLPDELYYYIHFLDYEKRMDNWMPASSILKKILFSQPISKVS
jgi:hypothetical protein